MGHPLSTPPLDRAPDLGPELLPYNWSHIYKGIVMKSTAWLPVLVLVAVVLATGFSWYLSSPDREYLFDGEKGLARPEVAEWWRVQAPMVLGHGIILGGLLIVLLRSARTREWQEAAASISVAVLGASALAGFLYFMQQQPSIEPVESELPTPRSPRDVFLDMQWVTLSLAHDEHALGGCEHRYEVRREGGVGLKNFPGHIPYDPFLLKRISFVGLTSSEVENLLGPPFPDKQLRVSVMVYLMTAPDRVFPRAFLRLSFADRWQRFETVRAEYLRVY